MSEQEGKKMPVPAGGHETISDLAMRTANPEGNRWPSYATIYLRLALGVTFLSAVADRFGIWGRPGAPHVAWGNFHNFLMYAAKLTPWFPASWIPAVGWMATLCEIAFGVGLILGFRIRITAFLSGLLLLAFALGMAFGLSIKAPLDYSVFTASAAAFLLSSKGSIDGRA